MTGLTLAAVVQVSLLSTGSDTYTEAHKAMTETGKPMVVMVGTDWCGPCRKMKQVVLPEVRRRGLLRNIVFALVNADREKKLAGKLIGRGPVPQLILFRKTNKGWRKQKLVGGQDVESIESFIREASLSEEAGEESPSPAESGT